MTISNNNTIETAVAVAATSSTVPALVVPVTATTDLFKIGTRVVGKIKKHLNSTGIIIGLGEGSGGGRVEVRWDQGEVSSVTTRAIAAVVEDTDTGNTRVSAGPGALDTIAVVGKGLGANDYNAYAALTVHSASTTTEGDTVPTSGKGKNTAGTGKAIAKRTIEEISSHASPLTDVAGIAANKRIATGNGSVRGVHKLINVPEDYESNSSDSDINHILTKVTTGVNSSSSKGNQVVAGIANKGGGEISDILYEGQEIDPEVVHSLIIYD
jgi:hypothetical protein